VKRDVKREAAGKHQVFRGEVLQEILSPESQATWTPIQFVILSGAGTSRSEVPAESKDPYTPFAQQGRIRESSPQPVWRGRPRPRMP